MEELSILEYSFSKTDKYNLLWTAQQVESSTGDATAAEDQENTNELNAESPQWNVKEPAVLSGSCSSTDQEYRRKEESFGNNKFLNPIHIQ